MFFSSTLVALLAAAVVAQPATPAVACSDPVTRALPFCDVSLSFEARAADLVARFTLDELGPQLTARNAPAVPRLGLPPFYYGTAFAHGLDHGPFDGGL